LEPERKKGQGSINSIMLIIVKPKPGKSMLFAKNRRERADRLQPAQMFRVMKLTAVLLLVATLQVSARTYSQEISINLRNVPITKAIREIRKQSGYLLLYNEEILKNAGRVTIKLEKVAVEKALSEVLALSGLSFRIVDNTIIIRKAELPPATKETAMVSRLALISGTVTHNINGQPLGGASIYNNNSRQGVIADANGNFKIEAQPGDVLTITFSGMKTLNLTVGTETSLQVRMTPSDDRMEEMIIVGYSQKKLSELSGSVQSIKGDELRQGVSSTNALAMLKGKASGLYITETGGGSISNRGQVVMRGQASFADAGNTNFGPLIVLDGVITTAANLQDIVNPNDIETITVLKDAASTAIFGSRAAQGVIVVTTKRGKGGGVKVDLDLKYGQTKDDRLVRFMNTGELAAHITKYMEAMYKTTASIRTQFPTFQEFYNKTRPYTDADLNNFSNWDRVLFTDGHEKDINLSLSAGSEKTRLYGAVDWYREDGTLIDDNLDRKAIRLNVDQQINSRFSISVNTNVLIDKYTASTSENQYYLFQPWVKKTYDNGQLADSIPNYQFRPTNTPTVQWYDNPVFSHSYNTSIRKIQSYLGSAVLKYKLFPWLTLQSTNTAQYLNNNFNSYKDPRTYRGRYDGPASGRFYVNGALSINDTRTEYYLTSNQVSFNKVFGEHTLNALVGQEYGKTHTESFATDVYNTPYPGERNLGAFNNFGTWITLRSGIAATPNRIAPIDKASFSVFGEANYSYRQKYFGSASLRRDASTNFGELNRYGTFFSVSGGWLLSKESFMQSMKAVNNLRLRASYGSSGREAGADFLNFTVYQDNVRYDNANNFGSTIQRLGNDQITWETTYSTNVGLDIGLWKRIDLSVDYYNRRSTNLIQTVQLPSYIGFPQQIRNIGELTNKGLEFVLSTVNLRKTDFEWTTDFNISFNKNRLTKIYGDSLIDPWSGSFYRYKNEDLNVLKAVIFAGVNPDNGRPLFERVMPDGKIVLVDSLPLVLADGIRSFKTVGSATPKFFGGITNTFRYKGITLSTLFNFVYGNTIMNQSLNNFLSPNAWQSGFNLVNPDESVRFWTGPGDTKANYPDFFDMAFSQRGATSFRSSLIFHDASYLRLRNVRLGYDLPARWLQKAKISSVNVYVSADNVFVVKSKELFAADPEGARLGVTSGAFTGTGFASAVPRRYLIGAHFSF
jgi:TonB-linked SusC/RagA family outer membrane protein